MPLPRIAFALARALTLSLSLAPTLAAQREAEVHRDLVYAGSQTLDIHVPPGAERAPVAVFVHGGGWRAGDKASLGSLGAKRDFFLDRGFVYVSVNYRLSPAVRHPAHVQDLAAALAHVHAHIADHGGDPTRVLVLGHSAGAHLAALVATDPRHLGAHGLEPARLRGVVLLDGAAYDLRGALADARRPAVLRGIYEAAFGPPGEAWLDAAPLEFVREGGRYPPFLIVHAGARAASAAEARTLAESLRRAGGSAEVFHAADEDHRSVNRDLGRADEPLTEALRAFVERQVESVPPAVDARFDFAAVDALLERLVADGTVPGLSLVVLTREGGVVHETTAGTGDLDAVLPVASATKIAGATVAVALADRGLLALDDRVGAHLPVFAASPITLAQCLSCTSGLGSLGMFRARRADSLEVGVAVIAGAARLLTPAAAGSEFRYGGAGFQVAGRVCEVAGGKPFVELFEELVRAPLGLSTWTFGQDLANPDLGGGARCSARDYARLLALHLGDGAVGEQRILSAEGCRAMRADRRGGAAIGYTPYEDAAGYGLGWWILRSADGEAGLFADPGAFGATPWIDTGRGCGAVLFLHGSDAQRPPRGGFRTARVFFVEVIDAVGAAIDAGHGRRGATAGDGPREATDRR